MGQALKIRSDRSAQELRLLARRERDGRASARMIAIANALEGMSRAEAARLAGMERQALRDAVVRYNAEGLAGLHDRRRSGPGERLTDGEQAALVSAILAGPDPERDGVRRWRLVDLRALVEQRFGVRYSQSGMHDLLKRLGIAWMSARPRHPRSDPEAREAFKKTSPPSSARSPRPSGRARRASFGSPTRAGLARRGG